MTRILTDKQIEKLSDKNLLAYYKKVRGLWYANRPYGDDMGGDKRFAELSDLKERIRKVLNTRSHVLRPGNPDGANINSGTKDPKLRNRRP